MTVQPTEPSLTITFNKADLEYIRGITQNYHGYPDMDEPSNDQHIRMQLFVAVSRALGQNMQSDGSIVRATPQFTTTTGVQLL